MHGSRRIVGGAIAAALLVTALGAPASAAVGKGTVAVVNGIPGERVDVCINGREIKSRLGYGGHMSKTINPGDKLLKIYRTDPRTCRGNVLAQATFSLGIPPNASSDLTLVATKASPQKVVVFDNAGLGIIPPDGAPYGGAFFAWRHASGHGDVNLHYSLFNPEQPWHPSANPIWEKGDQYTLSSAAGYGFQVWATRPELSQTLAKSPLVVMKTDRRYEAYLLGTNRQNARFIVFSRAVSQLAP